MYVAVADLEIFLHCSFDMYSTAFDVGAGICPSRFAGPAGAAAENGINGHPVTGAKAFHTAAAFDNLTATFMADHHRWFDKGMLTLKGVHVGSADGDRLYFDDHLVGAGD